MLFLIVVPTHKFQLQQQDIITAIIFTLLCIQFIDPSTIIDETEFKFF
jgi:hypothetical protein